MKYIVLAILNILFVILSYFLFGYLKRKYDNDKKYFLFMAFLYIIFIVVFNYGSVRIITQNYYNLNYNINDMKSKITKIENTIALTNDNITELSNELSKYKSEENRRQIELYQQNIQDMNNTQNDLNNTLETKKNELTSLQDEYNNLEKKSIFKIENFPTINQFPNYPNGCEIAALYLLLKYYGINVELEELANKLDKGTAPYNSNGILYGSNPETKFVGDPRKTNGQGYGVYQKPIAKLANQYKSNIIDYTGHDLDSVLKIVKSGKPVQVWASINLKDTNICQTWIDIDTGSQVNWRCNLHSMVLIGYTFDDVIVSDPYTGKIRLFSKSQFEKIYNNYGKRALYYE